jgi:hypothetical protein
MSIEFFCAHFLRIRIFMSDQSGAIPNEQTSLFQEDRDTALLDELFAEAEMYRSGPVSKRFWIL